MDGLLGELRTAAVLNPRHVSHIKGLSDECEKNEELFQIVKRRSRIQYRKFLVCLRKSGQHHVAHLIQYGVTGGMPHHRLLFLKVCPHDLTVLNLNLKVNLFILLTN